jgi:hypothetical protein
VLVPGCSGDGAKTAPECSGPAQRLGAASRRPAKGGAQAERGPAPTAQKTAAKGKARRHPFAAVLGDKARTAGFGAGSGPLQLKGVVDGPERTAIIREGGEVHFVRKGDRLGALEVLDIRDGEVVLGAGRRKRVLSLYQP